ncbi:efflux RND transporter periplasmic adaptor subunit [Ramlibacter sp.]|uniref:efflux RND transporter periplasmic adaptor subunit n=1 Tax=Ramlibacter sp. TaxID=1917967 RepID=UPI002D37E355|nr:efflux RND transporter periplasmic adaptor subunit [Ramlibacter sp.]HYD77688.1 efflux RND transporter periplasmic adaptor subunit [Ramlibacter sp.]
MTRPLLSKTRRAGSALAVLPLAAVLFLAPAWAGDAAPARPAPLATASVASEGEAGRSAYDGVVEAVRQTVIAAQVPGAIVALEVKAGDRVRAGQVLARLDARAAEQTAAAGAAQVRAARAGLDAATREYERQRQLFEKNYISQAALDRAEAQYKSAQAEAAAQLASAGAARTQSGFYVVKAPYSGVVADVAVVLGDMAMPGRPLLTVYDPSALRVTAAIPQSVAARMAPGAAPEVELPGAAGGRVHPAGWQLLPTVDPATHTLELRLDLPAGLGGAAPGQFARAWVPVAGNAKRLFVPARAVLRRAELVAVYVVGTDGKPLLRQVRLGGAEAERVEVLSGLSAGERVALDPQAAARVR